MREFKVHYYVISVRGKFYLHNSMKSMHTISIFDNSQSMAIISCGTTIGSIFFQGEKESRTSTKQRKEKNQLHNKLLLLGIFLVCSGIVKPKKILEGIFGK